MTFTNLQKQYPVYAVSEQEWLMSSFTRHAEARKQAQRLHYLTVCLREYADAYKAGAYRTREDYLAARKTEIQLHRENWAKEDHA
jgi:hypothetical protein